MGAGAAQPLLLPAPPLTTRYSVLDPSAAQTEPSAAALMLVSACGAAIAPTFAGLRTGRLVILLLLSQGWARRVERREPSFIGAIMTRTLL